MLEFEKCDVQAHPLALHPSINGCAWPDSPYGNPSALAVRSVHDPVRIASESQAVHVIVAVHSDAARRNRVVCQVTDGSQQPLLPDRDSKGFQADVVLRVRFWWSIYRTPERALTFSQSTSFRSAFDLCRNSSASIRSCSSSETYLTLFWTFPLRIEITAGSTGTRVLGGKASNSCISLRAVIAAGPFPGFHSSYRRRILPLGRARTFSSIPIAANTFPRLHHTLLDEWNGRTGPRESASAIL